MTSSNTKHPFDTTKKKKDLGVAVDTKMSFDDHINQIVNKATKIICRTFQFLDKETYVSVLSLYKTMVRTQLDCHTSKHHITAIENI